MAGGGFLKLSFKRVGNQKWKVKANVTGLSNQWMHVAGTWAPEGSVSLYKDGVLMDINGQSAPGKDGVVSKDTMSIGKMDLGDGDRYGQFAIDEWYFWDRQLSVNQVEQVYVAYQTGTYLVPKLFKTLHCLER